MTSTIEARPTGPLARALVGLFRGYQLARTGRVSPCRFTPTCSQYAIEAVEYHGARRGVLLALRRLGRCHPGGPSGYDPVPATCRNGIAATCRNGIAATCPHGMPIAE